MGKLTPKQFEAREVLSKKELGKLRSTGYEAYRVSPSVTHKYGKKYRKVYGATVEPDYRRPIGKVNKYGKPTKFGAKVSWHPHAYTRATTKSGTRVIMPLKNYPVDVKEARSKLMVRRKTVKKKKR